VVTLDDMRRFAVRRSLFSPTTLDRALEQLAFVQADPIRAPARAQDLTLRHRVDGYRAGDLERHYASLPIEEDVFINYGFVTRSLSALMHPRTKAALRTSSRTARARAVLAFVEERGAVHPRDVDAHFAHGTVTNYWGGSSNATTHLLDALHYKGLLRVVRRDRGIRVYGIRPNGLPPIGAAERRARLDALVDVVINKYAPVPTRSLSMLVSRLRYAVPQWRDDLRAAMARAKTRLAHAETDGLTWYWPADEPLSRDLPEQPVRFLAPFDPVVWDRLRFGILWGWAYRFEAYTPVPKRKLGYYALPLLWRDAVVGWGNFSVSGKTLQSSVGYVSGTPPRDRRFKRELDAELARMRTFLGVSKGSGIRDQPESARSNPELG
jgi:uncharacterized protein YcaQ